MALGNTYESAPDQQFTGDAGGASPGFFGNSEPAFGNEIGGWWGSILGTATGGLFGNDLFGGAVEEARNWAEAEFPIPYTPGATSSPFGTTSWQNGVLNMNASPELAGAMQGLFGGGGQLLGQGMEMAGQDWSGLRDEQLGILRELSRPAEERATASQLNQLFASGALGSTGGANQMQALSEAQQTADLQRQLQSINLANQQQDRGLQFADVGSGLFARGVQLGEPLFNQSQMSLDIASGRASSRAAGGRIATQRQRDRRKFGGDLFGNILGTAGSMFGGGGSMGGMFG